jgi:hypothetical protein
MAFYCTVLYCTVLPSLVALAVIPCQNFDGGTKGLSSEAVSAGDPLPLDGTGRTVRSDCAKSATVPVLTVQYG